MKRYYSGASFQLSPHRASILVAVLAVLCGSNRIIVQSTICNQLQAEDMNTKNDGLELSGRLVKNRDDLSLTVIAKNIGNKPLVIDRELVFLLHIEFLSPNGKTVKPVRVGGADASARAISAEQLEKRLTKLQPGASLSRELRPFDGFRVFEYGISESDERINATGYECTYKLPTDSEVDQVNITYTIRRGLREGFAEYSGKSIESLNLSEGPATAKLRLTD